MPHNRVSELQLDDPPDSWLWYSLLCTWAWPGLRSAVEAAASGHELSSGSGCDGVMASTWAQSQLRLRAQSHDTRARAHWPGPCIACPLGSCVSWHRHCVLIWPLVSPSHGSEGSQWQKVKQCPFDYRYQKSTQYWHTVRIRLSRFENVNTRHWSVDKRVKRVHQVRGHGNHSLVESRKQTRNNLTQTGLLAVIFDLTA